MMIRRHCSVDPQLAAQVSALRDAVTSTSSALSQAAVDDRVVRGSVYAALREQGLRRSRIRRLLGWSWRDVWAAAHAPTSGGSHVVAEVWAAVSAVLPWYRTDNHLSSEVMRANDIEPRHFTNVDSCDTAGAEYVHAATGEKWLIVSHQRWNGVPDRHAPDGMSHNGGRYEVWFRGSDGSLSACGTLGVGDAAEFGSTLGESCAAFEAVHAALLTHLRTVRDVPAMRAATRGARHR